MGRRELEALCDRLREDVGALNDEALEEFATGRGEMDPRTVAAFWDMVEAAPKVAIVGDYDCDGICASYVMYKGIKSQFPGKSMLVKIPRRLSEGYGIKECTASLIKEKCPPGTLVVTVDNGIGAADVLEDLEASGYPVAVTDHHEPGKRLPRVSFLVDPVANSVPFCGEHYWCGAGVALKLVEQMVSDAGVLRELEIVASLATVADSVPMIRYNWGLVRRGLASIRAGVAPSFIYSVLSLMGQSSLVCDEETFGFYLAPAVNASGRMEDDGGVKVFDYFMKPTQGKAERLVETNKRRKDAKAEQCAIAFAYVEEHGLEDACPIWVASEAFEPGIVGLVAQEISNRYGVPAFALAEKNGVLKGSGRSFGGVDLLDYLRSCPAEFIALGGHPGAAGLSLTKEEFGIASGWQIPRPDVPAEPEPDAEISIEDTEEVAALLAKVAPFGMCHPAPLFRTVVDFTRTPGRMHKGHLFVEGRGWLLRHFFHESNELENKEEFYADGSVNYTAYNDKPPVATFSVKRVFDTRREQIALGREK